MQPTNQTPFLSGVIEGFYGPPWSQAERLELFDWLAASRLNTYLYAPKDDLKHRTMWRERYSAGEAEPFKALVEACARRGLRFFYALSPGLDIAYANESDLAALQSRFDQLLGLGCTGFCLLFDDIPDRVAPADLERYGSLAAAQAAVANSIFEHVRRRQPAARFLFCPTPYCGRMAERGHGGGNYLSVIGNDLAPDIEIFWTGPEIISREIGTDHVAELAKVLRRKPLIWDNLHANDYDARRFFCGPYAGRPRELLDGVAGILSNPNCEFELNYIAVRTLGEFVNGRGDWAPREAYRRALGEWAARFETVKGGVNPDALLAFADCFYLPFEHGPAARELLSLAQALLLAPPGQWGERARRFLHQSARLREFCGALAEAKHRPLFHALWRRAWELREALALLEVGIAENLTDRGEFKPFASDFHLPGTWHGSFAAALQGLLEQRADGRFEPAPRREPRDGT